MNLRELIVLGSLSVAGSLFFNYYKNYKEKPAPQPQEEQQTQPAVKSLEDTISKVVLNYMAQPKFTDPHFAEKTTGTKVKLEILDTDEGMAYFSIPAAHYQHPQTLVMLTKNPQRVEFGQTVDGKLQLGDYFFTKPQYYFFRFPADDFRADPDKKLVYTFVKGVQYTVTMHELADFILNKSVYGGRLRVKVDETPEGVPIVESNHGAFVAKRGELSLTRLASRLTRHQRTKEGEAQALLDFVTRSIKYDETSTVEVLQRSNEVLMAREGDCSGMVIAYASLLEQRGIDYRLVHLRLKTGHIAVAVAGNFPNQNGLSFNLGKQRFTFAETTVNGFKIGQTLLTEPYGLDNMVAIQRPGKNAPLYHPKTGEQLPFL
ncbi:transglutaminase domain-containing protein [Candidatus Woesearchaeota archaeon]|nr:transglutaminase domain-containing protein [Candidatus Woesearchaeota archaeon]